MSHYQFFNLFFKAMQDCNFFKYLNSYFLKEESSG